MRSIYGLPTEPVTLKEMLKTEAAESFFEGLNAELPHAAAAGRMEAWSRCAESIIKLLVSDHERRFPNIANRP